MSDETPEKPKQLRGFALMDPARRKEIASKGGKQAHANGNAYEWDSAKARQAGIIGGHVTSANKEKMREIGVKGGKARWGKTDG